MIKKRLYLFGVLFIILVTTSVIVAFTSKQEHDFEEKRDILLEQLYANIEEAKLEGNYECCIDPPCTMCYLGNWIWDDGTCHCDEMIAKGEYDKVCPQCKNDLGEGSCGSSSDSLSANDEGGWCEI